MCSICAIAVGMEYSRVSGWNRMELVGIGWLGLGNVGWIRKSLPGNLSLN